MACLEFLTPIISFRNSLYKYSQTSLHAIYPSPTTRKNVRDMDQSKKPWSQLGCRQFSFWCSTLEDAMVTVWRKVKEMFNLAQANYLPDYENGARIRHITQFHQSYIFRNLRQSHTFNLPPLCNPHFKTIVASFCAGGIFFYCCLWILHYNHNLAWLFNVKEF